MPPVFSPDLSSSIASTKPTLLNRREDSIRRKNQRSSSWSAWVPPPLLRQLNDKTSPIRSSSLGRQVSPNITPISEWKEIKKRKGSFRQWGKRKDKKSVTFDEDVGASLHDFESASGTVRRQKLCGVDSVSSLFSRTIPVEAQNSVLDPVSRVDFANHSATVPGSWVERHTPGQEGTYGEYWSSLRRKIEETAKLREEQRQNQVTKSGREQQGNRKHQRTVSRDDQLIARGANPRTGVVSPSVMSGGSSCSAHDSQEGNAALQKWHLKGNEWISLDHDEKPPGNEISQTEIPSLQRSIAGPVGLSTSAHPAEGAPNLTKLEDKFVVNMPSAREPSPLQMTAQQIVDFQKTIERVHHEGEQMLDPDTLPTPRSITPPRLSTPPRRFTKNLKEKILGRKRGAKSPSPHFSGGESPNRGCVNGDPTGLDKPVPGIKVKPCSDDPGHQQSCENREMDPQQTISSHLHAQDMNREPFLGQNGGQDAKCTHASWLRTAFCPHCLSLQLMNARKFPAREPKALQEDPISSTVGEVELLERSQQCYSLTMAHILHADHGLARKISRPSMQRETEDLQRSEALNCSQQHTLTEQENLSTITTTMTPTSINTCTTSMSLPLIDQRRLSHNTKPDVKPDTNTSTHSSTLPEKASLCHSGTCFNPQQCRHWSETSSKNVITLDGGVEENINHDTGKVILNLSRNMHGNTRISERLDAHRKVPFTRYHAFHTQNGCVSPGTRICDAQTALVTTGLCHSPMCLNTISPMGKCVRFQGEGAVKKGVNLDFAGVNPPINRYCQSIQGRDARGMKYENRSKLLGNQNSSTPDTLAPATQFFRYIVRERHTLNFLRLAAVQFLTMTLHCLRVTMHLCDCCHKFSKTGVLPRAPRNVNDAGILVIDIGRACVYFAIMIVVCTLLAKGLGFLATVASWLAWPLKILGFV
ncbi:hypothetical protein I7I50_11569 [Histoplasma capsulatum G186AR]|uniref:Uncharacterized protein n=1 Tax=Ajellomyces capsulatus TaxID=5037 RepID=A0A8H7ZB22_AJECA|nr:hypothetical protein I7I52_02806 [Histoplasma capsulatum]QSS70066.1 hypothetical protein I7I50_11569 [Histoplasma capsulatum G186AR]